MGFQHVFHSDELGGRWLNMEDSSLTVTASRFVIVIALLPIGWLNVFVTYKLFKQLPKAIWLMALISTYNLYSLMWTVLGIPRYEPSIDAVILVSIIGAWITAFYFQVQLWKKQWQYRDNVID